MKKESLKSSDKATARPWTLHGKDIMTKDLSLIATVNRRFNDANAELIVRAVNSYDSLLSALKETAKYYHEQMHPDTKDIEKCPAQICLDNCRAVYQAEI